MSTTITCANCGKGEEYIGDLKACMACKMVKYCNRDCQIAHRPRHKRACKKRASEIRDEKLFQESPPPEDCPICFLPLSLDTRESTFKSCCGKLVCLGCVHAMIEERGEEEESAYCPFCRTPQANSNEEEIERTEKLMENGNANAFYVLAGLYLEGTHGVVQDLAKACELYLKAGELGYANGYYCLGNAYREGRGVELDTKKARHYYELGAMKGCAIARNNLGSLEGISGNHRQAMKHCMISASAGFTQSLNVVKVGFKEGYVTKEEYESTLCAHNKWQDEIKSDMRDRALALRNIQG